MILGDVERQLEATFAHLPTHFSRLEFLASVRDAYTGRYLHEGWVPLASCEKVHDVLQWGHRKVFDLVLEMPLVDLCRDLKQSLKGSGRQPPRLWLELETYRDMIPEGASQLAREFFVSQMKTALKILLTAPDWPLIQKKSASQRRPLALPLRHHLEN